MNTWGVSDEYWSRLSEAERKMYDQVRPMPRATYKVNVRLTGLERFLKEQDADLRQLGGCMDLEPDFQRGHVWSQEQQRRYVEALLRGSTSGALLFNCPYWTSAGGNEDGDIPAYTMQCVDGLQRLTAVREYLAGRLTVFDGLDAKAFAGSPFDSGRYTVEVCVYEFKTRASLLQFYLDLNSGGTVHSGEELERVRALKRQCEGGGVV